MHMYLHGYATISHRHANRVRQLAHALLHHSQQHADLRAVPSAAAVLMVCGFVLAWQKFYKEDDEDLA